MGYTNEQLTQMSYDELRKVTIKDMDEHPPVRGLGFPYYVVYSCKFCGKSIEGSERTVRNLSSANPVKCPYCNETLWSPDSKNCLRKTAYKVGHFDAERKKSYLKYLKENAKRKECK